MIGDLGICAAAVSVFRHPSENQSLKPLHNNIRESSSPDMKVRRLLLQSTCGVLKD